MAFLGEFNEQKSWYDYLNTVQQLEGVPVRMHCDKGTENAVVGVLQQYFRWQDDDEFAGSKRQKQWKSTYRSLVV